MKTYRFGVLGAGSMGKTIAAGAVRAGLFRPDEVLLFNRSEEKRAANRAEGYAVTGDFTEVYSYLYGHKGIKKNNKIRWDSG